MNTRAKRNEHYLKKCSFTGYRPQKMPFGFDESDPRCVAFKAELRNTLEELIGERYEHSLSGSSLSFDMLLRQQSWNSKGLLLKDHLKKRRDNPCGSFVHLSNYPR